MRPCFLNKATLTAKIVTACVCNLPSRFALRFSTAPSRIPLRCPGTTVKSSCGRAVGVCRKSAFSARARQTFFKSSSQSWAYPRIYRRFGAAQLRNIDRSQGRMSFSRGCQACLSTIYNRDSYIVGVIYGYFVQQILFFAKSQRFAG